MVFERYLSSNPYPYLGSVRDLLLTTIAPMHQIGEGVNMMKTFTAQEEQEIRNSLNSNFNEGLFYEEEVKRISNKIDELKAEVEANGDDEDDFRLLCLYDDLYHAEDKMYSCYHEMDKCSCLLGENYWD